MNCYINELKQIKTLTLINPETNIDFIIDFMSNFGALTDGQFVFDEALDAYVCTQEIFEWWDEVIDENQALEYRIHDLIKEHGSDAVNEVTQYAGDDDLAYHAVRVHRALTEAFGE